jgi:hypothetical protein
LSDRTGLGCRMNCRANHQQQAPAAIRPAIQSRMIPARVAKEYCAAGNFGTRTWTRSSPVESHEALGIEILAHFRQASRRDLHPGPRLDVGVPGEDLRPRSRDPWSAVLSPAWFPTHIHIVFQRPSSDAQVVPRPGPTFARMQSASITSTRVADRAASFRVTDQNKGRPVAWVIKGMRIVDRFWQPVYWRGGSCKTRPP